MSEVIEKPTAKTVEKSARILNPQRMGLAEQLRQDWVVNAEEGTTIAEVLDPQYWAHMAAQMQPYDRVDVRLETGEWMLELLVVTPGRNWAQVHLLHHHELATRSETLPAAVKHKVEWKGPQRKHVVIRLSDDQPIQENFATKAEANAWLANHEKITS